MGGRGHRLMIAGLGLVLFLDQTGLFGWRMSSSLWPFLIIGLGLARFSTPRPDGTREGGWLIFIGTWLLLNEMRVLRFRDSWPRSFWWPSACTPCGRRSCGGRPQRATDETGIMNGLTNTRIRISGQLIAGLVLARPRRAVHARQPAPDPRPRSAALLASHPAARRHLSSPASAIDRQHDRRIDLDSLRRHPARQPAQSLISSAIRFWPLILVGVGVYVVWQSMNRREVQPGDAVRAHIRGGRSSAASTAASPRPASRAPDLTALHGRRQTRPPGSRRRRQAAKRSST